MILSEETFKILKNFSQINDSLLFKPGNKIQTISPTNDVILAQALVTEEFPVEFAIYEMSKFLGALSLFQKKEINFDNKYCIIGSGKNTVRYMYASANTIRCAPYKDIKLPEAICEVDIEDINAIMKAAAVLESSDITFNGDGTEITIKCENVNNNSANVYKQIAGTTDKTFKVGIKTEHVKLLDYNYKVTVTKPAVHFHVATVDYWIAASA